MNQPSDLAIAKSFTLMVWSFIFFIDFRIMHVDILPDTIGWIIFYLALKGITDLSWRVPKMLKLTKWLIPLSIVTIVEIQIPLNHDGNIYTWYSPTFPIDTIVLILNLLVIWTLCELIEQLASINNNHLLTQQANFRKKLYVGLFIGGLLLTLLVYVIPAFAYLLFIMAPIVIVLTILMFTLLMNTKKMYLNK